MDPDAKQQYDFYAGFGRWLRTGEVIWVRCANLNLIDQPPLDTVALYERTKQIPHPSYELQRKGEHREIIAFGVFPEATTMEIDPSPVGGEIRWFLREFGEWTRIR